MTAGRRTRLVAVVVLLAFASGTAALGSWRDMPEPVGTTLSAADTRPDAESLSPQTAEVHAPAALDRTAGTRLLLAAVLAGAVALVAWRRRGATLPSPGGPPPTRQRRHSLALRAPPLLTFSACPC